MAENNFYRERLVAGKHILTLDSGDWIALSPESFSQFKQGRLKEGSLLYNALKDRNIILDQENRHDYVEKLRARYSHLFTGPSLHIVSVTERCNNSCIYCHASAKATDDRSLDLETKTARKIVDFILQSRSPSLAIEFQGGEPLLNMDTIKEIITYSRAKAPGRDIKFLLVTNMSLMDEDTFSYLKANRVGICTSLDGPAHVHDVNRKSASGKGTHAEVEKWIRKIKPGYPLHALLVPSRQSLSHPEDIVDEYARLGFSYIQLKPMSFLGYAQKNKGAQYSAQEYISFWKKAMARIIEVNKAGFLCERLSTVMLRKLYYASASEFVDLNSPCGAAISTLAYNHKGEVFSCDEGRQFEIFKLGDAGNSLESIYESRHCQGLIRSTVNDCLLCDSCAWKPYCGICVVCNYAETANLIPVLSKNDRCKILMAQYDWLMEKIIEGKHNELFLSWISTRRSS
jgi:uncharacterized protein